MPAAPRTTMSCPTRRVRQPLPWQPPPPHHRIRPRFQLRRTSKRIPRTEVVAQTIPLIVVVDGRPSAPSVAQIVEQARRRCGGETTLATTSAMRAVSIYIYIALVFFGHQRCHIKFLDSDDIFVLDFCLLHLCHIWTFYLAARFCLLSFLRHHLSDHLSDLTPSHR